MDSITEEQTLILAAEGDPNEPVKEGFSVKDEDSLNWVLDLIRRNHYYLAAQQHIFEQKLKRLEEVKAIYLREQEDMCKPYREKIEGLKARFGPEIHAYVATTLSKRAKSRKVNGFVIGSRQTPEKVEVLDQLKMLEWAKANLPKAVKESVLVSEVKAFLDDKEEAGLVDELGNVIVYKKPGESKEFIELIT